MIKTSEKINLSTVVPQEIVEKIYLNEGQVYAVARAMPYKHNGDRTFEGTTTVYYEANGRDLSVRLNEESSIPYVIAELPGGDRVCLW